MKSLLFIICFWACSLVACLSPSVHSFTYIASPHSRDTSPTHLQKIYLDSDFGESDLVSIDDALQQWQYALNGYWTYQTEKYDVVQGPMGPLQEVGRGDAWIFLKINSRSSILASHDKHEAGRLTLAFVDSHRSSLYLVRDRIDNTLVRGVTMHEIGHLLGADHIDESEDLMNPLPTEATTQCVDRHTLQQVAHFNHLPLQDLNYCVYLNDKGQPTVPQPITTHVTVTYSSEKR